MQKQSHKSRKRPYEDTQAVIASATKPYQMRRTKFPEPVMRRTKFPEPVMRRTRLTNTNVYETELYKSMNGLLIQQVQRFCAKSGLPFDEIRAQADLLFMQALRRFDDEREVKFSSFLTAAVHNGLVDYGKKLRTQEGWGSRLEPFIDQNGEYTDPLDTVADELPERQYNLIHELAGIADQVRTSVLAHFEGKKISKAVIELHVARQTEDVMRIVDCALCGLTSDLQHLVKLLKRQLGWSEQRISKAVETVKEVVNAW